MDAVGPFPIFDFDSGKWKTVIPIASTEFYFDGGDHTGIAFVKDESNSVSGAVLNPGRYDAAQSWSGVERIIAWVEAGPQGTNTRFIELRGIRKN